MVAREQCVTLLEQIPFFGTHATAQDLHDHGIVAEALPTGQVEVAEHRAPENLRHVEAVEVRCCRLVLCDASVDGHRR